MFSSSEYVGYNLVRQIHAVHFSLYFVGYEIILFSKILFNHKFDHLIFFNSVHAGKYHSEYHFERGDYLSSMFLLLFIGRMKSLICLETTVARITH